VPRRLVNLALLASVAVLLGTGVIGWLVPVDLAQPLGVAHQVAGVALVLGLAAKYGIVRRSLRRRGATGASVVLGLGTAVAVAIAAGLGLAWTAGAVSFDRPFAYSAMSLHVIAGLALGLLVVAHALVRGERRPPLGSVMTRRVALRGLALLGGSLVLATLLDAAALPRRFTGSRGAGSFTGNQLPTTIWALDTVPQIDVGAWRLRVSGRVERPGELTYAELLSFSRHEVSAVLDCTGGWWSEQRWSGVRLGDVVGSRALLQSATAIEIISVTGHRWSFDRGEAERALLATHIGDEPISTGHGYPVRLVPNGHRGFTWIKWIGEVRVV
jgi:Oxidoreductase molybdopterin binding domain